MIWAVAYILIGTAYGLANIKSWRSLVNSRSNSRGEKVWCWVLWMVFNQTTWPFWLLVDVFAKLR